METCVLIPHELSIILLPNGRPGKLLEMGATLWANQPLRPGSIFLPDEGRLRLDRLEIFSDLGSQDVRRMYGCFDEVIMVDKREVRHCNWVRFLQASSNMNDVNVVAQRVRNRAEFHIIKPIPVNGELRVYFEELMTSRAVDTLTASSSVLASRLMSPHLLKTSSITSHYNSPSDHLLRRQLTVLSSSEDDVTPTDLSMRKDRSSYTSPSSGFDSPSMHHCSRTSTVAPKTNASVSLSDGGGIEADRSRSTTDSPSPRLTAQTDDVIMSAEMHHPIRSAATESCSDDDENSSLTSGRHSPNWLPGSQDDEPEVGDDETDEPKMAPLYSKMAPHTLPMVRRKEKTWLPCDVCGKKFDRPSLLKRHMRTHTGEKPHVCDVCFKAFSTSSSLNTHRRIHSGEKPHECPICGKRFTASSNLYYHRMTHKKEKPHKCDLCAKSFPTPGDLKSHMYVHSGSWPYKCDVCNRGFSKQANLKNHLLLHTGDKPHNCDTCGKKFALLCNLKTHIKMHEEETSSTIASPLEQRCDICQRPYVASKLSLTNNQSAGICSECSARHSQVSSSRDTPVSASFSIDSIVAGGGNDSLDGADSTKSPSLVDLSKSLASQLQLQQKLAIPSVTRISLPTVAAHAQYYAMAASGLLPSSLQYGSLPRYPIGIPWPSPAQQYGV